MSLRLPALVCAASIVFGGAGRSYGQAEPAAAPSAAAAPAPDAAAPAAESLKDSVDNFWHYGKIARYDVAATEVQHILSQNVDPLQLLTVFEAVAAQHHDDLDEWLLRWQGVDQLSAPVTQLITILAQGHNARRNDPKYIEQNIQLLATNQRGYDLSIDRLRESGELAVPMMLDYLRDPSKAQYHGAIRRALRGLGLSAVNPLLAATEMRDEQTLITIVSALGDIGYDVAVPYLARLIQLDSVPASVKSAAADALHKLRVDDVSKLNTSDLFYDLGERFYYDNAAVRADKRLPVGYVWYWTENNGLTKIDVPQPIFHDVMSKRAAEYSLKLGQSRSDALSLWLAADYQDEADLPAGQTDPTLAPGTPSAHYFGTAAGIRYLNQALARANKDRNSPVAMKVITSMQEIGGQANLFGAGDHPLMESLRFPDRLVQYEAAFALAAALPSQQFSGQEHVIPLLSEALSQTGAASILVVVQTQDELNGLVDGLRTAGYNVVGGITPEQAVAAAAARPTIDAILISEDIGPTAIARLSLLAGQTSRLDRAVKVIVTKTKASPYSVQAVNDPMLYTTQVALTDTAGLKAAIEGARQHGGLLPLDAATADRYATRAADLLAKIAVNRSPVFDLTVALNLLLTALDDSRADIVKSDATVLGLVDSPEIQPALLAKASNDKTADDLKIAVYKALATNARNFGNKLTAGQVSTLQNVVGTAANVDVRTAAAEARGALNLPADQAKLLIMQQSKTAN
jgi:HEAT repeat protein